MVALSQGLLLFIAYSVLILIHSLILHIFHIPVFSHIVASLSTSMEFAPLLKTIFLRKARLKMSERPSQVGISQLLKILPPLSQYLTFITISITNYFTYYFHHVLRIMADGDTQILV